MTMLILNKFSFILLCLSLLMSYINGMEPEQKSSEKQLEHLMKKPTSSAGDSHILEGAATNDDHWATFEQNLELSRQQLNQHIDNLTVGHSNNPFREGSSSSSSIKEDFSHQQKMKEPIEEERRIEHRRESGEGAETEHQQQVKDTSDNREEVTDKDMETAGFDSDFPPLRWEDINQSRHQIATEGAQNLQDLSKQDENISLGENKGSIQEVDNNAGSWKSKFFDENKFDFRERQDEFPDIASWAQTDELPRQFIADSPSVMKYKEMLKDCTTTNKVERPKLLKQTEMLELEDKEHHHQSKPMAIPKIVKQYGFEERHDGSKPEKSRLIEGNSPKERPAEKQATTKLQVLPPQTPPDGAIVMHSRDKGEIMMSGANVENYFDALLAAKQDERRGGSSAVQFIPDSNNALPTGNSSYYFEASKSKGKEAEGRDKMTEKDYAIIFYTKVDSIVDSIYQLGQNKAKCMEITKAEKLKKKEKLQRLMDDYLKIMKDLEDFSETYISQAAHGPLCHPGNALGEKTHFIIYIGEIFLGMNKAYKASVIDEKRLMRIMQECLVYLEENLKNNDIDVLDLDDIFKKTDHLERLIVAYEKSTKTATAGDPEILEQAENRMDQWYMNVVESKIRRMMSYLFVGLYNVVNENAKLRKRTVYMGFSVFLLLLQSRGRQHKFLKARQTVEKYMEILPGSKEAEKLEKSKTDLQIEKYRDIVKNHLTKEIQLLYTRIEYILEKISALESERPVCLRTEDSERRIEMKKGLKRIHDFVMVLLANFLKDYGHGNYGRPQGNDSYVDILNWMAPKYIDKVDASDLIAKMKDCVQYLQNNEPKEDVTNFESLLKGISDLIAKADQCDELAKSTGGYRDASSRAALQNVQKMFQNDVDPQLREAIGYVFIGMRKKNAQRERLPKYKYTMGLFALTYVAIPKYEKKIENSACKMGEFFTFLDKASPQEISENLAEYLAKMLGIDFLPENGDHDLEILAAKIEYPTIYQAGIDAIDEILLKVKQSTKEDNKTSSSIPTGSKAGAKKGKKKAVEKKAKIDKHDFGPVTKSNWEKVLNEARKLIRYLHILVKIQWAEEKMEEMVFDRGVYLRAWTILFRDKLAPMLDEWKAAFFQVKNKDPLKEEVNLSTIIKFYSDGIFNFVTHQHGGNEVKGKQIREALEHLSELQLEYDMWHRFMHLRKWLYPGDKLDAKSNCDCIKYHYLTMLY